MSDPLSAQSATEAWEPRPGEMHPVDQAFYDLAVKERNYERVKCDRLSAELDDERHRAWIALGALEVDSEWSADRLLDAIGDAIAALKGDPVALDQKQNSTEDS